MSSEAVAISTDIAIRAQGLAKCFMMYRKPSDRLKQMLTRGRKRYHEEFWALKGIDFEVYRGETVGIIGRNGSGKSTLLQLICGTLTPTHGTVEVRGRVAALLELGAGFNPEFTGRENVFINAAVLGLSHDQIVARFEEIEAFADIGEFIDQPVKTYSSGMYARLAFAVAIHVDPEILIVDEILAVGDAAFQRKCIEKFYQIRESGCTILFVSHDAYTVRSLCQRAIYLSGGNRVAFGPAADVMDRYVFDMEEAAAKARAKRPEPTAAAAAEPTVAAEAADADLFKITSVRLENSAGEAVSEVRSGEDVRIRMKYRALVDDFPKKVSFVVNLYRHDDFYICGTTTLMEGMEPFDAAREGEVLIDFPDFRLLSGNYKWRVAINDHRGLVIYTEAKHVCPVRVVDSFRAVGLVDLPRQWQVTGSR